MRELVDQSASSEAAVSPAKLDKPDRGKPPLHAFEVSIKIGGDDWEYVVRVLRELAEHVEDHGPDCGMCSGGAGGCHSVDIRKRDVTPEQYHRELMIWAGHLSSDTNAA